MSSAAFRRERYLLSFGLVRVLDERYVDLPRPGSVLQMNVTNLRNRRLSIIDINSVKRSFLSMYHSLVTGSKDFPVIATKGIFSLIHKANPFPDTNGLENPTWTSPTTEDAPAMMEPTAGESASLPKILTPVLPDRAELDVLGADRRNCVRRMEYDGCVFTRVISTVYSPKCTELTNRWRVTDYDETGLVIMSVLCQFLRKSAQCAQKRKDLEEDSSSSSIQSPPKKRIRL